MPFIGVQPATVPLTSSDITDGIISTAKIADDAVGNTKLDLSANYAFTGTVTGAGKILQVVQAFKDDVFSTTSTSYVDVTGMSATITPSSSSNKILVQLRTTQAMDGDNKMTTNLVRGSTTIANADGKTYFSNMYPSRQSTDTNIYIVHGSTHLDFLDTPSTTSSTTYKLQLLVDSGTGYINRGRDNDIFRGVSSITLMEIAVWQI